MSDRRIVDFFSVLGLGLSFIAVLDMLARWDMKALQYAYLIYTAIVIVSIFAILFTGKMQENFLAICRKSPPLLGLRIGIAAVLLLLGWYINAAMKAGGVDQTMTAYNGVRMFLVVFTLISHVFYFAFTKKAKAG